MSIFFDFDVGSTGRRFRKAVDGDKSDINLLLSDHSEQLFGNADIGSLIEVSILSICLINQEKDVMGFMALGDYPPVPAVDPAHWEIWIRNMYQKFYLSRNTLFIHHMCCADSALEYFLEEALVSVFDNDLYLQQIVLVLPPECPNDILFKHPIMKKKKVYQHFAKGDDEYDQSSCLYVFARQELCPRLKMRRAVEDDNDDIVAILDKKCPRLMDLYGAYYISEIIGRHPEINREIAVAEHHERVVGVMCLNTDIDYKKLNACYELRPYHGLMKATALEKERAKRANTLLETFGDPIMLGKWSPFQEFVKTDVNKLGKVRYIGKVQKSHHKPLEKTTVTQKISKVYFGQNSFRTNKREIPDSQHHSEDSEGAMFNEMLLQATRSVSNLLEADAFEYEIVNIDKSLLTVPDMEASVSRQSESQATYSYMKKNKQKRRPSVKQKKTTNNYQLEYEGEPNAFMIELFGFQDDVHERYAFELLQAVFELMKIYDYCIIKVPCAEKCLALLQHFCFVPTKPNICSKHALYVAHRSAILGKLRVREAELFDVPQIASLLQDLEAKETLWTIENSIHNNSGHKAYVFQAGLAIIGVAILEQFERVDLIRARYNLGLYHNHKYHQSGHDVTAGFAKLKVLLAYSTFEVHYRFFARDLMRLSGVSALLWMTAYRNKYVLRKANSLACAMIPLLPRQFDLTSLTELKKLTRMSTNLRFSTWFIGRKLTSVPKVDVNSRLVVIGASRTAMAFLSTLLFSDTSTYLNFTSVTLISPNGLPYVRHSNAVIEMMFLKHSTRTDRYLKSVPYTYYVNVIQETMIKLDNKEKYVKLSNGKRYYYDFLFLLLGTQYQHPNYASHNFEKGNQIVQVQSTIDDIKNSSSNYPPYVRLDIPRRLESSDHLENKNVPHNVFIINNVTHAKLALEFVKSVISHDIHRKIIVYGGTIHAYCCLSSLLELKVPPNNIVFVEPFPLENEDKIRVPLFCNYYVDHTIKEVLDNLKIVTYRSYYYQSWTVDEYNYATTVHFLSHFELLRLECSAFFYYGKRGIDIQSLDAICRSGIVYDGGILIDDKFQTNDPFVYAAGSAARYLGDTTLILSDISFMTLMKWALRSGIVYDGGILIDDKFQTNDPFVYAAGSAARYFRRYHADTFRHKFYDSYEVGAKLAHEIKSRLDPLLRSASKIKGKSVNIRGSVNGCDVTTGRRILFDEKLLNESLPELPVLKKPITIHCILPGGLQYLEVRSPGLKIPNLYVQTLEYNVANLDF